MDRAEKQQQVDALTGSFSKARIALCAGYHGLSVAQITDLRRKLRKTGSTGRVVKNTLAKISLERAYKDSDGSQLEKFKQLFDHGNFLVLAEEDPVGSSKVLADFSKTHEAFKVKGGWFEGSFLDAQGVEALARMPSREELLAKLLSVIAAPATQLVRLLQAPGTQMVRVLDEQRKKLEGGAAAQ